MFLHKIRDSILRNWNVEGLRHLTAVIALTVLGGVVGWFVGQSGSDANVLAAVLPAVLSAGGVFVVLRSEAKYEPRHGIVVNVSVAILVISIFLGSKWENSDRSEKEYSNIIEGLDLESKYRDRYLEQCSIRELKVNVLRAAMDLPPLPGEVFCRQWHPTGIRLDDR